MVYMETYIQKVHRECMHRVHEKRGAGFESAPLKLPLPGAFVGGSIALCNLGGDPILYLFLHPAHTSLADTNP